MEFNRRGGNGRRDGRRDYGTRNSSDRRPSGEGRTFGSDRPRRSFGEGGDRPRRTFGEGSDRPRRSFGETLRGSRRKFIIGEFGGIEEHSVDKWGNEEYLADYIDIEDYRKTVETVVICFNASPIEILWEKNNPYWG